MNVPWDIIIPAVGSGLSWLLGHSSGSGAKDVALEQIELERDKLEAQMFMASQSASVSSSPSSGPSQQMILFFIVIVGLGLYFVLKSKN